MKKIGLVSSFMAVALLSAGVGVYAASDIKLFINGKAISTPVEVIDGSSYVPLRVVSEALGADVKWDGDKREIQITSSASALAPSPSQTSSQPSADKSEIKAGDLTFLDLQVAKGLSSMWRGTVEVKNTGKDLGGAGVTFTFYGEDDKRIGTITGVILDLKSGETKTMTLLSTSDLTGYKTVKAQIDYSH